MVCTSNNILLNLAVSLSESKYDFFDFNVELNNPIKIPRTVSITPPVIAEMIAPISLSKNTKTATKAIVEKETHFAIDSMALIIFLVTKVN